MDTLRYRVNRCILTGFLEKMHQTDIRTAINACLEMAIADLMHCENLPDHVVESSRFKLVLQQACFIDSTFKVLSRKKIGGNLLDINYENCMEINWLSDGVTISRMPLINTLALCASVPTTCVSINNCSDHIELGDKNDAPYIASLMEDTVLKYDPTKLYTDIFFFDGTCNAAKQVRFWRVSFVGHTLFVEGSILCLHSLMTCQKRKQCR